MAGSIFIRTGLHVHKAITSMDLKVVEDANRSSETTKTKKKRIKCKNKSRVHDFQEEFSQASHSIIYDSGYHEIRFVFCFNFFR